MSGEARETWLRINGNEFVVRTETGGRIRTQSQLEAAHTRAVRDAIVRERTAHVEEHRRSLLPTEADEIAERRRWYAFWMKGAAGSLTQQQSQHYDGAAERHIREMRSRAESFAKDAHERAKPKAVGYADHAKLRAPHPPVKYTYPDVPASVRHLVAEGGDAP